MLRLLTPKHQSVLGVDIRSTSINAIEISNEGGNQLVQGFGSISLPPNAIEGHVIRDVETIVASIKQLMLRGRLHSKSAVVAVPDSAVISKILQVNDDLSEAEIEEFIVMEADKYIPYPIEEISIDFEILGASPKNTGMLDVLIVASRSENVTGRVDTLVKAGLQVNVVDVESFAIERSLALFTKELPAEGQDKVIALIEIGEEMAKLFVLYNMKVIYTREDEFGSKQLINEIASHYHLSVAEAQRLKDTQSLPSDYTETVLNPFVETLLVHVKRALQFFFSTGHYGQIDQIMLAGSAASLPNLVDLIHQKTQIPTMIANPMPYLTLSKKIDERLFTEMGPSLLIACGLALRSSR